MKSNTVGWVQECGKLKHVFRVVALFDASGRVNKALRCFILPRKVTDPALLAALQHELEPVGGRVAMTKVSLVGRAPKGSRKFSQCNGVIQALIPGQRRNFIGDWPADSFLRFALTLGWLQWEGNRIETTTDGLRVARAPLAGKWVEMQRALLEYPPVFRVLSLLDAAPGALTKFELGGQLGFLGEGGFTHYTQDTILDCYWAATESEQPKVLRDWEGTVDKYARMIAAWLCTKELGLVRATTAKRSASGDPVSLKAWEITDKGRRVLAAARGGVRRVQLEALATQGDKDYLRMRRSWLIHMLVPGLNIASPRFDVRLGLDPEVLKAELRNLENYGLELRRHGDHVTCVNHIVGLEKPDISSVIPDTITRQKAALLKTITLDTQHLVLLDFGNERDCLAYEIAIVDLLKELRSVGLNSIHLGGPNRPDAILFGTDFVVVIDAKAYVDGFDLPIKERDKMVRYLRDFTVASRSREPNAWWEKCPNYKKLCPWFGWVAPSFGNVERTLVWLLAEEKYKGSAWSSENLIRWVDAVKKDPKKLTDFIAMASSNRVAVYA